MKNAFEAPATHAYRDGPPRQVPGYASLLRMTTMLLAERAPRDARVLVLGAGGGLELEAFAQAQAGWRFDGVDPSPQMLALAKEVVGPFAERVALHEGTIDAAPEGPFDAASCLLTFHFIARDQRLPTLRALRRRLKPGAPFVLAHISFSQQEPERSRAIARHVAFGASPSADEAQLEKSRQAIATRLSVLAPEEEEALLREAGFTDVAQFYAALSFRGWVCVAG